MPLVGSHFPLPALLRAPFVLISRPFFADHAVSTCDKSRLLSRSRSCSSFSNPSGQGSLFDRGQQRIPTVLASKQGRRAMATTAEATNSPAPSAAVVGAGVAGLACASELARQGVQVSVFEMARGPGGRTSQRRVTAVDGTELRFDHGAQYFTVSEPAVRPLVSAWLADGTIAEWLGRFGEVDAATLAFSLDQAASARYVGVPGMNAMCKTMASLPGVTARYGTQVARIEGKGEGKGRWHLSSAGGEDLGAFDAVVCTDKTMASKRFTALTGSPPPLDFAGVPTISERVASVESAPCFAAMLAFSEPLTKVPFDGAKVKGSPVLAWIARDSSKPGRRQAGLAQGSGPECWVLHSTEEYAREVIGRSPTSGKPSAELLDTIAREMHQAFAHLIDGGISTAPIFATAHRWGGAFPKSSIAKSDKCVVDGTRIALAGDFCTGPKIEFAISSGLAAAQEISKLLVGG